MSSAENSLQKIHDTLILVDEQDNEIGTGEKLACHLDQGLLHRAFSVFLFNLEGQLLIQQRSENKMLWPLYWANSCCSHPRAGEHTNDAARRRIDEELGVTAELKFLYKFVYQAAYEDVGSEHENCWVYVGHFDGILNIDASEIASHRFIAPDELTAELEENPGVYSPWLKLEWAHILQNFAGELPQES
jgi:isopentenyl-diphosphate delta-isomerase